MPNNNRSIYSAHYCPVFCKHYFGHILPSGSMPSTLALGEIVVDSKITCNEMNQAVENEIKAICTQR